MFAGVSDPEGVPLVSVSEESHDIRPAMGELAELIRDRKGSKPLVILTGEVHDVATHVLLPQIAMQSARAANPDFKIAHGIERSHNLLDLLLRDRDPREVAGELSLAQAYMMYEHPQGAPVTRRNVMDYCIRHGIPVQAVDTAGSPDGDGYLDQREPSTRALVSLHAPELLDTEIPGGKAEGIRLRNIMALNRIKTLISESGADVCVVPYGGAHLLGWKYMADMDEGPFPSEDSLGKLLHDDPDVDVMILFSNHPKFGTEKIPEDVDAGLLGETVVIDGLSPQNFWQKPENAAEVNADLGLKEGAFLREMARQSGGALEISDEVQHMAAYEPDVIVDSPADWGEGRRYET
ncbi:MAG: hypothetical protein KDI65_06480 [Alphaproteobacteria bacterium]|nr:hypothetical protein [Alphaproteobacteria bacterium]